MYNLQDANTMLPIEDHWAIGKIWSMDQRLGVAQTIIIGNDTRIRNISFKHNISTETCIIEANNNINSRIYAVNDTPGNKTDQSQYFSKLGGISMMLLILKCVIRHHGITQGSIQAGLDWKKACVIGK